MTSQESSTPSQPFPWAPPRLYAGKTLPQLLHAIWDGILEDDCIDQAAQMSFYFSLSLFPFLIVIAAFVGWLPSTTLWHNLAQWITDYLPRGSRSMVFTAILDLTQGSTGFLSLGLAVTIWTASSGFVSLMESITVAYGLKETRGFWMKRLIAVAATVVGAVFFVASFGLMTFGHWLGSVISGHVTVGLSQVPFEVGRWLASALLMLIGLDLMNYFLPNMKRRWHWITPGAVFVVLMMVAASAGFNFYLHHFGNYPRFYGAMAGFIILLTWIYLASLILLVGAETDSAIEQIKRHGRNREAV